MTEKKEVAGGASDTSPVGNDGSNDQARGSDQSKDMVSYETHRKLLAEKKKAEARLEELERQAKEREEAGLKEKEDWKKLYERTLEEKKVRDEELTTWKKREEYSVKIGSFLDKLDGQLDRKYFVHVDADKILINPETGEVDESSVIQAVKTFKETYPELIKKGNGSSANLPKDHPKGGATGTITRAEWLKLDVKDMTKYKPDQIVN